MGRGEGAHAGVRAARRGEGEGLTVRVPFLELTAATQITDVSEATLESILTTVETLKAVSLGWFLAVLESWLIKSMACRS
jgi:hypothetical protein